MRQEIYFIYAPEVKRFKIGYTENIRSRFGTLSCASPCDLDIIHVTQGGPKLEKECHRAAEAMQYKRIRGEWFEGSLTKDAALKILTKASERRSAKERRIEREQQGNEWAANVLANL